MKKQIANLFHRYWVVLLAPAALLGPVILRGQALFWGTPSLQFVAWWVQVWESLRQGALPLWNPLNGMGAPLIANYQLAFFYPLNWTLLLGAAIGGAAGIAWVYTLLAVLHLAWGGLGMSLLLHRMGFAWLGQVLGGLSFALSGYIVGRLGFFSMAWVWAWLPWVIYFTHGLATAETDDRRRLPLSFGLVACLAMQLLAGHAQLTWYSVILAGLWCTMAAWGRGGWRRVPRAWLGLALSGLLAAGIAAVQLIPTFEYLLSSHRADAVAYENAMTFSFWPWRALTIFSPDFFGSPAAGDYNGYASYWEDHVYPGLLPILLVLVTLVLAIKGLIRSRRSQHWGLLAAAWALIVVTFVLALGDNTAVFPFLYQNIPTFDMFQAPARYLIWFAFLAPVLAAVGVAHWRTPVRRGLYWFRLATAGAFAVTLGAGLALVAFQGVRLSFVRATALTGLWGLGFGLLTLLIPWSQRPVTTRQGWRTFLLGERAPKASKGNTGEADGKRDKRKLVLFGWKQKPAVKEAQVAELVYACAEGPVQPWRATTRAAVWQWAVIGWVLADLLLAGWGLNPGVDLSFYQGESAAKARYEQAAPGGERVYLGFWDEYDLKFGRFLRFNNFAALEDWKNQRDVLIPNLNLLDQIPSANNFDPLVPGRYARWIEAVDELSPSEQAPWMALMGVGLVERVDVSQPDGVRFDPVPGAARWHWFPCAAATFAEDEQAAWMVVRGRIEAGDSPWEQLVLEGEPGSDAAPCDPAANATGSAEIRLLDERPDRLSLAVDAQQAGWLFVADTWHPGWRAAVDGQSVSIYPANAAFRAVFVPAGKHEILFNVYSFGFYFGGLSSILILLLMMLLWTRRGQGNA